MNPSSLIGLILRSCTHNFISMRKHFLVFGIFLLIQPTLAQQFQGGVIAGLSTCQVDGDDFGGYNKAGFIAGAYVLYPVSNKLNLTLELKYIGKGSSEGSAFQNSNNQIYRLNLHYIEIPVIAQIRLIKNFFFEAGTGFGYLFHATENFGQGVAPGTEPFINFEWSGQLGIAFKAWDQIQFDLRYSYSLLPVRNLTGSAVFLGNRGQFNKILALQIQYKLGH